MAACVYDEAVTALLASLPELEDAEPEVQYVGAEGMPSVGPARLIVGESPITFEGSKGEDATFVLGSAVPHPHQLRLGSYSVHTSAEALTAGERHLDELKQRLDATGDRRTGSTPVFRK